MHTYLCDRGEALEQREECAVVVSQRGREVQFSVCVFSVYCMKENIYMDR